ncbi:outer membrane protein assembly factor BamB family protein [Streptomyces sp. BA2]|uniref:outer membrane protein assembly factor BamB family protein n=1 Tax=Streptomyces sp. BA2 TaxID=436595 RepID=UPI0013243011|nr:PQQ-binding-like beta-propeller repeat protein [Streptomyces sp. BA2]MWA15391.1 PQQ-binding-like beta-propeller repeat protein [Streptomyces sp. BA2]
MTQPPPPEQSPQHPQGPGAFGPPPQGAFGPPPQGQAPGFGPPVAPPPSGFGPHQVYQPIPAPASPPGRGSGGSGGGGGGRRPGRRTAIVVSVVAAIALIVGGGVWYATSADGGSKDKTAAKPGGDGAAPKYEKPKEKAPKVPKAFFSTKALQPKLPKGETTWKAQGSWLTDKVYAKASVEAIVGVDASSGKGLYRLPKPGESCAGSPDVGKGNIAVVVTGAKVHDDRGFKDACTEVTAFDVDTGEKLWTKSITVGYQKEKTVFNQVTISGDTVAVGGLYGGAAFDLRGGDVLWEPKQGDKCRDVGYGGGERLVAVRSCGDYGSERFQVQLLDPATGKSKWTHKLPAGVRSPSVVSTEPVVVALDSGEITSSGATDVFSLDEKGDRRTRIALPDGKYLHECGTVSVVQDCKGIAAGNGKLYVPTKQRDGAKKFSSTNDIVVFSLATGKTTGEKVEAGDSSPIFPIRMDGGNVLVYKSGPYAQVVSLDGRDLKKETLLLDAGTRPSALPPLISELRFRSNKLFLSSDLLAQYSGGKETIMMFGFAAK